MSDADLPADPPVGPPVGDRFEVVDVPGSNRFELHLGAQRVGHADYVVHDGVMTIPHVETVFRHRGKGFAARLMAGLLADVRRRGLVVRPICPYAADYLRDHPAEHDLLAD